MLLLFFSKITFCWKLFSDCYDTLDYSESIVYLSFLLCNMWSKLPWLKSIDVFGYFQADKWLERIENRIIHTFQYCISQFSKISEKNTISTPIFFFIIELLDDLNGFELELAIIGKFIEFSLFNSLNSMIILWPSTAIWCFEWRKLFLIDMYKICSEILV